MTTNREMAKAWLERRFGVFDNEADGSAVVVVVVLGN